jgi:hypothetical protein
MVRTILPYSGWIRPGIPGRRWNPLPSSPDNHLILFTMYGDVFNPEQAKCAGISGMFSKTEPIALMLEKALSLLEPPCFPLVSTFALLPAVIPQVPDRRLCRAKVFSFQMEDNR